MSSSEAAVVKVSTIDDATFLREKKEEVNKRGCICFCKLFFFTKQLVNCLNSIKTENGRLYGYRENSEFILIPKVDEYFIY